VSVAKEMRGNASNPEFFSDIAVLQRKWRAALKPGRHLPFFEDVVLGSLGRLADNVMLLTGERSALEVSRAGRYVETWLEGEVRDLPLTALSPDCAVMLEEAVTSAHKKTGPHHATAHCVRHAP